MPLALDLALPIHNESDFEYASLDLNYADVDVMHEDCVFRATTENYVMIAAFSIIFCLSVIGNSVVVLVILQVLTR